MAKKEGNPKAWWEYLDWSFMRRTFQMLQENRKRLILDKGHWSLGKGNFYDL
jgi:hypothetical protein